MKRPLVAAVDLLANLVLVFAVLALLASHQKPQAPQNVQFAIVDAWAAGSAADVDTYVRDPTGQVCYFADPNVGLMNLEHDDLGTPVSGVQQLPDGRTVTVRYNGERVDMRGFVPGEYTVNVQAYDMHDAGPTQVHVQLWEADRRVVERTVTLDRTGAERTAFRFTLTPSGRVTGVNQVQAALVTAADGGPLPTG